MENDIEIISCYSIECKTGDSEETGDGELVDNQNFLFASNLANKNVNLAKDARSQKSHSVRRFLFFSIDNIS
jgi:hypothetical protein